MEYGRRNHRRAGILFMRRFSPLAENYREVIPPPAAISGVVGDGTFVARPSRLRPSDMAHAEIFECASKDVSPVCWTVHPRIQHVPKITGIIPPDVLSPDRPMVAGLIYTLPRSRAI